MYFERIKTYSLVEKIGGGTIREGDDVIAMVHTTILWYQRMLRGLDVPPLLWDFMKVAHVPGHHKVMVHSKVG